MGNVSKFVVRTSGRRVFRRCLRKWGLQSSMRRNLQRKGVETNIHFWFGSAIHFAQEDFFGHNRFGDSVKAFQAYYAAFPAAERPMGADEHYYLGMGMLDYFKEWYAKHNQAYGFETVWLDKDRNEVEPGTPGAEPLIEESFLLDLGIQCWVRQDTQQIINLGDFDIQILQDDAGLYMYDESDPEQVLYDTLIGEDTRTKIRVVQQPVMYHGTMDRIVKDRLGRWYIMDWKTAKSADTNKLDTDDQISAYMWAAEQWFGRPIHGFVYVQMTKELPKPPKELANGTLSVDKKQKTTHALFKKELVKRYGSVTKAPNKMIDYLNYLATQESPEGDRFVRWDIVYRNKAQKEATFNHVRGEVELMINPDLYLYPNPTRDCIWDCPFRDPCLMMDNGQADEAERRLDENFEQRPREEDGNIDSWRKDIPWPDSSNYSAIRTLTEQYEMDANVTLNIILPEGYDD